MLNIDKQIINNLVEVNKTLNHLRVCIDINNNNQINILMSLKNIKELLNGN